MARTTLIGVAAYAASTDRPKEFPIRQIKAGVLDIGYYDPTISMDERPTVWCRPLTAPPRRPSLPGRDRTASLKEQGTICPKHSRMLCGNSHL